MTREEAYDELINPLMSKIIALCKEHDIPAIAQFQINDGRPDEEALFCTTSMVNAEADGRFAHTSEHLMDLARRLRPPEPMWAGFVKTSDGTAVQVTGSNMTDADTERALERLGAKGGGQT